MTRYIVLLVVVASLTSHVVGQLEFTVVPSNVTVENGETVTLPCIATGAVIIGYVWHDINGNISSQLAISGNSSQRMHLNDGNLTFTEVSTDDEGVYVCEAIDMSNPHNNISSDPAYLTVTMVTAVPLSLTISPADNVNVHNDSELLLHCVAMGDTYNITYDWYKNNISLVNDHRLSVLDNGSLLINTTDYRHDNGDYHCEATDRHGNNASSNSTSVSVVYLEENFQELPKNQSVVLNDTDIRIRINCIPPEGNPAPLMSWRHRFPNGTVILVNQDDRVKVRQAGWLTINDVQISDGGFYQCVASNGYYERSSPFVYLNVLPSLPPPCPTLSFNTTRPTMYGVLGKPLLLDCTVPGSQDLLVFKWKKGATFVSSNVTLWLQSYSDDDSGTYSCSVSSRHSTCSGQADVAHFNVITAEINYFTKWEYPVETGVGTSFNLTCSPPDDAKPPATVVWTFNGVPKGTDGVYNVESTELSDAGLYMCTAENVAGVLNYTINVTILEKPTVTINSKIVQLGSEAVLTCSSTSQTVKNMTWHRHQQDIDTVLYSDKYSVSDDMTLLTIMDIDEGDFGAYQCVVTDDKHVTIIVTGYVNHTDVIYFTHGSNSTTAEVKKTARFTCSVSGAIGNVVFSWYDGALELKNDTKYMITSLRSGLIHTSELRIMTVGEDEQYTYLCIAQDMEREISKRTNFTLNTTRQPYFIERPANVTRVAVGEMFIVHCIIGGRPKPPVTWVYNNNSLVKNQTSRRYAFPNGTLLITEVMQSDYGLYVCHATGKFEESHQVQLAQPSENQDSEDDEIAGLDEDVFLVVIGAVVVVIIYTTIMCLLLCLCCYCRKQDNNKPPPYRQERNLYTPDPEPMKEGGRGNSVLSKDSNGVKDVPGMTYYDLPHPFSRASSDARSHDTMELIGMGGNDINNTASRSSQVTEPIDNHDNQYRSSSPSFPRSNLQFANKLGDGEFGPVYQGLAKELVPGEADSVVAIKMLLHPRDADEESMQDLENFRAQMKLQYTNIASILAMCTDVRPYYIVYEYLDCGDLKKFLRNSSPEGNQPPKLTQHSLLQIILQVADGMSYLSSNKIIHGDLAARNCLISSELRVKVADLGIGHDVYNDDYYDDGTQLLPIRWMPPEILRTAEFSIYSDMWSFGVLCWEVFSFGRQPYEMVSNEELLNLIPAGLQLQIPEEGCPNPLYAIMQDCWHIQPEDRPKFAQLCVAIIDLDLD